MPLLQGHCKGCCANAVVQMSYGRSLSTENTSAVSRRSIVYSYCSLEKKRV